MINFTQGDTAVLQLTAQDGNGNPINLIGASFTTLILGAGGVVESFPNSQHSIVSAATGQYSLSLSAANTAACNIGLDKTILTYIVQGGTTIYYRGVGVLNVFPPVPLQ